jgi:hypothetical protein
MCASVDIPADNANISTSLRSSMGLLAASLEPGFRFKVGSRDLDGAPASVVWAPYLG